ncbi:hypothetical protein HDU83_000616 [Entophlyctis luteolus]|nr:hypothetical protein HDU83_000616 [Entophlyctis luteolus]
MLFFRRLLTPRNRSGAATAAASGAFVLLSAIVLPQTSPVQAEAPDPDGGESAVFSVVRVADARNEPSHNHHLPNGSGFVNPWPSFDKNRPNNPFAFLYGVIQDRIRAIGTTDKPVQEDSLTAPPVRPITKDILIKLQEQVASAAAADGVGGMALTWLGHAAFLLTTPDANVLLDPCLSDRCSPVSFAGPRRVVRPPCALEDLPVDIVVVSHNHYDHLDINTMTSLARANKDIIFFVPLGNKKLLIDAGIKNVVECDWWDSYEVVRNKPVQATSPTKTSNFSWFNEKFSNQPLTITCTPCQHFSSRTLFDRNETLWSSWYISTPKTRFFFGGDTGYRSVSLEDIKNKTESALPTCPAFREVRTRLGSPHLSALPIGAYEPRHMLSPVHLNPYDAVDVHVELGSRKSVAMHWGTFGLGMEAIMAPPRMLREALAARGIGTGEFMVVDVGETVLS